MVPNNTTRHAEIDDIEEIRTVARKSWEAAYSDFIDDELIENMLSGGYNREILKATIDSDTVALFVAEQDGDVTGYLSSEPPAEGDVGHVSIYVDPNYWGEGSGTALLERASDHLRDAGAAAMRDTVLADNEVGNAFYEKHFERDRETTVEMAGEEFDAYLYRRDL